MDSIVIEALLVRGEGENVRVILGPYCLDFAPDDVLTVDELPLPCDVTAGSAIAGRVTLRPGARLIALASAAAYQDVLWPGGLPFALATRRTVPAVVDSTMSEREEAFFAARGLTERLS